MLMIKQKFVKEKFSKISAQNDHEAYMLSFVKTMFLNKIIYMSKHKYSIILFFPHFLWRIENINAFLKFSGGAGGKGVWGKLGSELLEEYEDFNDPNYDSETCNNGDVELKIVFPALGREELQVWIFVEISQLDVSVNGMKELKDNNGTF